MATHANVGIGHGCTIAFAGGQANVEDLEWTGISRDAIETTHMETSEGGTFLPSGNYDPGSLSITWQLDPAQTTNFVTSTPSTAALNFSDGSANWAATAFISDYGVACPDKDKMMASATLKFTGDITFS